MKKKPPKKSDVQTPSIELVEDERARRVAARNSSPGLKTTLAEAPGAEDLSATTTAEQRLSMMWELTLAAWSLSGKPMPDYVRSNMPGRVFRPGDGQERE